LQEAGGCKREEGFLRRIQDDTSLESFWLSTAKNPGCYQRLLQGFKPAQSVKSKDFHSVNPRGGVRCVIVDKQIIWEADQEAV